MNHFYIKNLNTVDMTYFFTNQYALGIFDPTGSLRQFNCSYIAGCVVLAQTPKVC